VLHDIGNKLDNKCQVDTLYLDFAKAFDKVNHELLLLKLSFGISGNLLSWPRDYLSGRYQRVTVLGETSNPLPVLSGVSQGSILGPLPFLVYVYDLPDCVSSSSSLAMFADDCKCYHPIKCSQDAEVLQSDINAIHSWCKEWQMSLNHSKCGLLSITRNSETLISKELDSVPKYRILEPTQGRIQDFSYVSQSFRMYNLVLRAANARGT
jgi:hypothetical protein